MSSDKCYCQILGINPFKESEYDSDRLVSIIEAAIKKWASNKNNADMNVRTEAILNHRMSSEMMNAMTDAESRRAEFDKGRKELEALLNPLLRKCVITEDGKKHISPRLIADHLGKFRWDGVDTDAAVSILGIEKGSPKPAVDPSVTDALTYLLKVNAKTPMDALNALIHEPAVKVNCHALNDSSTLESVKDALKKCNGRMEFVKPADFPLLYPYVECLRRMDALAERGQLDSLIRYSVCHRDLEPTMEALSLECAEVDRDRIDMMLPDGIDTAMAIPILQSFCYRKSIGANFSREESSLVMCPSCKKYIVNGDKQMYCKFCGSVLKVRCPRCETLQSCSNKVCPDCGFDFVKDMERARQLAMSFRTNISRGNIEAAKADLSSIKDSYSDLIKTATMEYELEKCAEDLKSCTEVARNAYRNGRYYSALKAFAVLGNNYPEVLPNDPELDSMRSSAEQCFDLAQACCTEARNATDDERRLELYVKAAEHCMDHPAARSYLRNHPPQGVTECEAIPTKQGTIMIKFKPPADSKGVSYCIYRGTDIPMANEDTDPLEVISKHKAETGFEDKTVESGVKYHYVLASKRWGILSRPMQHIGPVVAFENAKKVSIDTIEDGFHISFERPKRAHAVRISRCVKGDESNCTDVTVGDRNECDDYCMVGNVYIYYFWTEYMVDGVLETSA